MAETHELKFELPFDGEYTPADTEKFRETIVFVHHFGGTKASVERHAAMVRALGFATARFTLLFNTHFAPPYNQPLSSKFLPITGDLKFGARHLWSNQIESFLNAVPGKKIIYSFSMPSNSVLESLARRQAKDVVGWICDGGPFLELPKCIWNLYENQYKVVSRLLRAVYTGLSLAMYGTGFPDDVPAFLAKLPAGFPILSIRGRKDALVPLSAIEEVFSLQKHLQVESVILEEAGHLDGLRRNQTAYTALIEKFLRKVGTPAVA